MVKTHATKLLVIKDATQCTMTTGEMDQVLQWNSK